jgi:superfamily I DNA/RNA helicase
MSILMRNHVLAVLGRTPRPLNEFEEEPLLADLSSRHGTKSERKALMRAYGAAWARLQAHQPGFTRTPEEQAFVDELVGWLTWHEAMLLDEVIPYLFRYLHDNPGAAEHREFAHLLIDEYQDLNRAEQEALRFLGTNGAMCVIGDDDQSIYSFRHAHPDGIRQWATLHPTDEHAISECRRCPTTVVHMANALISRNTARLGTAMMPRPSNGPGEVVVRQYANADLEADAVADKIASLIASGVEPREIIVLAQRKTFATPIFQRLRARGIPTKSYYAETELDTMEAQERFALLKLFLDREDRVALRWLLGRGHDRWHASSYARVTARAQADGNSPWETMQALAAGNIAIPYTGALVTRFREIQAELTTLESVPDLDQFIQAWLPTRPETELLAETVAACREGAADAQELFDVMYEAITRPEVPLQVAEVRVMSLHKSKGLSSPYVFIVGCVEGLLPSRPDASLTAPERQAKLEEDRRLFYVGITRVKADLPNRVGYLALTYPQRMPAAAAFRSQITPVQTIGGIAILQPSRFFAEMAPHCPAAQFNTSL